MYKTYYTKSVDNAGIERIGDVVYGDHRPPESEGNWLEAPNDWEGNKGDKLSWFDDAMRKMPTHTLVERGIVLDNIGIWYNKQTREPKIIRDYDIPVGDGYTRETPLQNEPYQKWDEDAGQWIVDTEKKERVEKEAELCEKEAEAADCERKRIRSVLATLDGEANAKDAKFNLKYKTRIIELRGEIATLKVELGIEDEPEEELESA